MRPLASTLVRACPHIGSCEQLGLDGGKACHLHGDAAAHGLRRGGMFQSNQFG